jgi:hypothetical protein
MSAAGAVLQYALVAVLVAGCALFSAWRLAPLSLRLRALQAISRVPALRSAAWLGRLRERSLAQYSGACGGCAAGARPGAPAQNQTPGALRR